MVDVNSTETNILNSVSLSNDMNNKKHEYINSKYEYNLYEKMSVHKGTISDVAEIQDKTIKQIVNKIGKYTSYKNKYMKEFMKNKKKDLIDYKMIKNNKTKLKTKNQKKWKEEFEKLFKMKSPQHYWESELIIEFFKK